MKNKAFIIVLCLMFLLLAYSFSYAQNWAALPPYNLLWPLWSPPLVNDFNWDPLVLIGTTPIITEPSANTVLPLEPGIIWDPVLNPKGPVWLLYNVPPAFGCGDEDIYRVMPFPPTYIPDPVYGRFSSFYGNSVFLIGIFINQIDRL